MPKRVLAKIICPVEETGKNSVMPSTIPKRMASKIVIRECGCIYGFVEINATWGFYVYTRESTESFFHFCPTRVANITRRNRNTIEHIFLPIRNHFYDK